MGGIQNDPPSDGASAMAWGDCCLHALLNPDLAGEAGATVVSAAPEVSAAWWEKYDVGWFVVQRVAASKKLRTE